MGGASIISDDPTMSSAGITSGGLTSSGTPAHPFGKETLLTKQYIKQGHVVCGICCDARRACIILDSFSLVMCVAIGLLLYFCNNEIADIIDEGDSVADADIRNDLEIIVVDYGWVLLIFLSVNAFFAIIGIIGAYLYRKDMVVWAAFWNCFLGACSLFSFSALGLLVFLVGFFAYPHFVLFQEIGEGIMSEDNYPNEMHSCCCLYYEKPRLSIKDAIEKRVGVFA